MRKITTNFTAEEYIKITEELATLGVNYMIKRRHGSNEVILMIDDPNEDAIDEAYIRTLIANGIKKYRFKNKENYDDLSIENYTPAQINQYIENNVTNLADVKRVLKIFARIILYLVKHLNDDV